MSKTDASDKGWQSWLNPSRIPARGVLGILSFFGFFTNYMLRVNLNIAIVSMTGSPANSTSSSNKSMVLSECLLNSSTHSQTEYKEAEGEFDWDTKQQSLILGSFYWSYILIMVPGGMVAEKYGGKVVYGGGNLLLCVMALAIPLAARINVTALLVVRLIQGLAAGVTWPAMHVMASQWIPPHERSKFVSTYMGNSVGIAVTYPLCGVLIDAFGWEAAFYVPGLLCLLWCVWWWFCAFDSPAQHPRISKEELAYLEQSVVISKRKLKLPLKAILLSMPFWALVVANIGTIWAFMTVITYGPTYLKTVHGLGIKENGLLSGLPNLSRFVGSLLFSWVIDSFIASKTLTITFARKLATAIAQIIPAAFFLLMGNIGCNARAEIALLTIATFISGSASSGTLVNSVDLAPNFSGSLLGLISIVGMSSGFVVPLVVGMIIGENQSMAQWRYVFIISAALGVITTIIFSIFGSGEAQPWNEPDIAKAQKKRRKILKINETDKDSSAIQPLKSSV